MDRRLFLQTTAAVGAATLFTGAAASTRHIATNVYPWFTYYRREDRKWDPAIDLKEVAATGVDGFEPLAKSPEHMQQLGPLLPASGLAMRSIYVNSLLHEKPEAERSVDEVLRIAEAACELGTKIVVTNPSPIAWGGKQDKTDAQLREQGRQLERLGKLLKQQGQSLAYHNHDAELRQGGREFHHMLAGTDPAAVKLCLDAHWVYRGCGDSEVAVFDALRLYGNRIIELHLRQSTMGVWRETFTLAGDIDYARLINQLAEQGIDPHLVLEQAVEGGSPKTLGAREAHVVSRENLARFVAGE